MNLSATLLLLAVLTLGLTIQSVESACEGVSDEATLQAQFSSPVAGSVITVCSHINLTATVNVKAPVTLQGNCSSPGCKISAALPRTVNQLFSVAPGVGPVFFKNLQLDGGAALSSDNGTPLTGGGVLLSPSSATTFTSVLFTNNAANEGGAVFSNIANATFVGCTFTGNTATASGGAFQAAGGSATILSSTFQQNSAPSGGAVYLQQTTAPAIVRGSLFVRNQATAQQGGAVFVGARAVNASIGGNTFAGNTATVSGGALHDDGASQGGAVVSTAFTVLSGNSFSQNTAPRGAAVSSNVAQTSFCSPQQFSNNVATTQGNSLFAAGSQDSQGTRFCPTAPSDPAFVSDVPGVFASDCTYCNCGPNNPCDANAICTPSSRTANLTCTCRSGFSGNGYVCLTATNSSLLVGNAGSSTNLATLAGLTTSSTGLALAPSPVAAPPPGPAVLLPAAAFLAAPAPAPAVTNSSLSSPAPAVTNSSLSSPALALTNASLIAPAPALTNSSQIAPTPSVRNGNATNSTVVNAAAPSPNPALLNGTVTNGTRSNGTAINSAVANGTVVNSTLVNGTVVNGPVANGPVPSATTQNGTLGPAPAPGSGGGVTFIPLPNANLTSAPAPGPPSGSNRTNVTASGPSSANAPSPMGGNATSSGSSGAQVPSPFGGNATNPGPSSANAPSPLGGNSTSNASSINGTLPFSTNATLNAAAPQPAVLRPPPPQATNATFPPPPPLRPPPPIATNASFPPPQSSPPPAFSPPTSNATLPLVTNATAAPPPVATNATAPPPPNVTFSPPPSFPPPASPPPNPPPASPPPNPPPASPPPNPPPASPPPNLPPPGPPPPGAPPPPLPLAPVSQPPLVATSPAASPPNLSPPGLPPPGAPPPPLVTAPVAEPLPAATTPQPAPTAGLLSNVASPPPPVCTCPTGQAPGIGATATACNCNYPFTASYRLVDKNLADWTPAFASSFTNSLSNLLGTQPSQILYTNVQQGSILLDTNVVPLSGPTLDNATASRISGKLPQGQPLDLGTTQFGTVLVSSVGLPAQLTSGSPPVGSGVNVPSPNTAPAATTTSSGGGGTSLGAIIGGVVGGVVGLALILAVIALLLVRRRRRKPRLPRPTTPVPAGPPKALDRPMSAREKVPGARESSPLPTPGREDDIADKALFGTFRRFGFSEIQQATEDFAPVNLLGEGGFGLVYKGTFADGTMLAVKYLKNTQQGQAQSEFLSELGTLGRVRHRNLVSLKGFCVSNDDCFLILDYAAGGNLDQALRNANGPVLTWPQRLNIAVGAARGLSYLHNDCRPTIIHRDIKSANILLDADGEAEVADFGLAKLLDSGQTHQSTRVRGTYGYVAPEYAMYGQVTKKTDVYSFGVVLLELITGLKALDVAQTGERRTLAEWVLKRHQQPLTVIDPRLEGEYFREQAEKFISLAIACINISGDRRPSMLDILRTLETLNPSSSVPASPLGSPERSGEVQDVYPTTSSDWSLGTGSGTRRTPVGPSSGGSGSSPAGTHFSWSQGNSSTLLHNTTQYDLTRINVGR